MPRSPGTGFLLGGFALLFFTLYAFTPLLNAVQPCAWYDLGCGATRWLLWWVLVLGSLILIVSGLAWMWRGKAAAASVGAFAFDTGRRGAGYAKRKGGQLYRDYQYRGGRYKQDGRWVNPRAKRR